MQTVVALGYYTKEQYELLLQTSDDRKELHDSWEEFIAGFIKAKTGMEAAGLTTMNFNVNVPQMVEYFKSNRKKNTSKNRAAYASEMASQGQ